MTTETGVGRAAMAFALAGMLAVSFAEPGYAAGAISTGAGVQVWNGHSCAANVPVNIASLSAGLSGYESKIGWDPARFSSVASNITIDIGTFLTNGGTRQQTGDSGTPALKAASPGALKFGAYSWGAGNPAGNSSNGQLAVLGILPTATCGNAVVTPAETQLVDITGAVIAFTSQTGSAVAVFSRYDASGGGAVIDSADVNAVVAKLNQATGGTCGPNYRYDASVSGALINSADVNAVVAKLSQTGGAACVN